MKPTEVGGLFRSFQHKKWPSTRPTRGSRWIVQILPTPRPELMRSKTQAGNLENPRLDGIDSLSFNVEFANIRVNNKED